MNDPESLHINGEWRASDDGSVFDVTDPANGDSLSTVSDATAADGAASVVAAANAQAAWAQVPVEERAGVLRHLHDAVLSHSEEFADLISAESGKPVTEAMGEVSYGAEFLSWFADQATQAMHGDHYLDPKGQTRILTSRRPAGPALLITPWNFPLAMITRKMAPALAAGCTLIIKPAEQTPLTAIRLVELLADLDLPPGVVNLLTTTRAPSVSAAVLQSPDLRKLSFTGSTAVGRQLLRSAADHVVKTSMELGGNAPLLVFADAPAITVEQTVIAKLRNGGQSCVAANRILVQDSYADEFTADLIRSIAGLRVGPGRDPGTDVGPLIDAGAVTKIQAMVDEAIAVGARVLHTSSAPTSGSFLAPIVLTDVPRDCALYREEIFGPVVTITRFRDEDEAVRLANDTEAGLAAYVFTGDVGRGMRVSNALDYGIVGINRGFVSTAAAPFGGVKTSGLGREGGLDGLSDYLETQYCALPVGFDAG